MSKITTYIDTVTDSASTLHRSFCSICGSNLSTTNETLPEMSDAIVIMTGIMDGTQDRDSAPQKE